MAWLCFISCSPVKAWGFGYLLTLLTTDSSVVSNDLVMEYKTIYPSYITAPKNCEHVWGHSSL